MAVSITCPHCQSRLSLRDELVGKRIRCPRCQQILEIQPASGSSPSLPAPQSWPNTDADVGRQKRRRRKYCVPARDPGLSGGELALFAIITGVGGGDGG